MSPRGKPRGVVVAVALAVGALVFVALGVAEPAAPADEQRTITSQGQVWQYLFHRPASVSAGTGAPLVVVLHGSPDTPEAMAARTRFDASSDRNGFLVAYPRLPLTPGGDDTGASKIQVVADIIGALEQTEHAQSNRVFVTGFSGGAVQSYRMACFYADKVAAIASVSGLMIRPDCTPTQPVSIYEIHGTSDGTFPFNGGRYTRPVQETIDRWIALDKCSGAPALATVGPVQRQTWGSCADATAVQFDAVVNGVHGWPGDPKFAPGTPDGSFDATDAIWQFFASHGRPAPAAVTPAALLSLHVVHKRLTRSVTVTVRGPARTKVRVSLLRSGRVAASLGTTLAHAGNTSITLTVPKKLKAGHYRLRVQIGAMLRTRRVTLPAP
jgi:polyhydroxybutyrate depolymerase